MKPVSIFRRKRAAALVVVLSILAVLITLVLAFFSMVQTERVASGLFSNSVEVRNLAELPVNLAISQIRKATENNDAGGTDPQFKTWASQPGMIRVFGVEADGSGVRSKATALYKLYSDDKLVVTKSGATSKSGGLGTAEVYAAISEDVSELGQWNSKPGMFVDLNEPVPVPGETPAYKFPIVDPRASVSGSSSSPVDGFSYDASGGGLNASIPGTTIPSDRDDLNARLPMPVKWMYVLADGSLSIPASGDDKTTTFSSGTESNPPTEQNPIVGRIAFWTDDEASKVNINTASEGTHWDMPISTTQTERDYALYVPAQGEYSRYPGHPATTSLSPIFQAFSNDYRRDSAEPPNAQVLERLHKVSPRTPWGGTRGGTTPPDAGQTTGLLQKNDRLYASVDELFLDRNRELNIPSLDASAMELGKFFLTAHSRSPEMTLFGKPKVSLWPISNVKNDRNPKDKLLAFLSETTGLAGRQWYVTRRANFKSNNEPGSSQVVSGGDSDYPGPTPETGGVPRNRSIFENYLRQHLGSNGYEIPGFANGTHTDKWGAAQRDQVLAGSLDLLRWGVNSYSSMSVNGWPSYTFLPGRVGDRRGQSSAAPLEFTDAQGNLIGRGFGRWPTITETAIVFMRTEEPPENGANGGKMQAYILLEPFWPMTGPASTAPNIIYRIKGLENFRIKFDNVDAEDTTMGFASSIDNIGYVTGDMGAGSTPFSMISPLSCANGGKTPVPSTAGGDPLTYPFVSVEFEIPADATKFTFSGGPIQIMTFPAWQPGPSDSKAAQIISMNFAGVAFEGLPRTGTISVGGTTHTRGTLESRFVNRSVDGSLDYHQRLVMNGDFARSVEVDINAPPKGDLRFYSAMREVPASWFSSHPFYADGSIERIQFLRHDSNASAGQFGPWADQDRYIAANGQKIYPAQFTEQNQRTATINTAGTLLAGFTYARGAPPAVPRGLKGAFMKVGPSLNGDAPGDWDNGIGVISDGPYIRKPDEGNAMFAEGVVDATKSSYLNRHFFDVETGASYSPQRQIASAVAFGSMPTGINLHSETGQRPWSTLLFCPNPHGRSTPADGEPDVNDHLGFKGPRDHLLLDFFWMPVSEPYAISEPFSTAGKVNMNYQIVPFTNIERSTGIKAVLKSARVTAIHYTSGGSNGGDTDLTRYKVGDNKLSYKASGNGDMHSQELRYAVNENETLQGFRNRFELGDIFRSASEICNIYLVPKRLTGKSYGSAPSPPTSYDAMNNWWNGNVNQVDAFELTGDNSREAPYNHIYPRLTTQSNTYTVHFRVQKLQKARTTAPNEWVEGRDTVSADYRGSTMIERYLDPNETGVGSAQIGSGNFKHSWDSFFRIRVIQRNQFVP